MHALATVYNFLPNTTRSLREVDSERRLGVVPPRCRDREMSGDTRQEFVDGALIGVRSTMTGVDKRIAEASPWDDLVGESCGNPLVSCDSAIAEQEAVPERNQR